MSSKAPPLHLVVRDIAVFVLCGVAWWLEPGFRDGSALGWTVAILTGGLTAFVGFLMHEYGHLGASLATGAKVSYPRTPLTALIFHFDSAQNDRRQFMWMSLGGYVATLVAVGLIVALCPLDAWSGRIALLLAGVGTLVTFVLEVPITARVWRGAPLPLDTAYRPHEP